MWMWVPLVLLALQGSCFQRNDALVLPQLAGSIKSTLGRLPVAPKGLHCLGLPVAREGLHRLGLPTTREGLHGLELPQLRALLQQLPDPIRHRIALEGGGRGITDPLAAAALLLMLTALQAPALAPLAVLLLLLLLLLLLMMMMLVHFQWCGFP
jgi:hypothetical protein